VGDEARVGSRLVVTPDRARAADLGVSMDELASALRAALEGEVVARVHENGRRIDVRVSIATDRRGGAEALRGIHVRARDGRLIPLAHLVRIDETPEPEVLRRRNGDPIVRLWVKPAPGSRDRARAAGRAIASELGLGVRFAP
jgi:multidrug efflux pump subunit AcrB